MTRPDPATRPAALALESQCPDAMWPDVRAFLTVEHEAPAHERFRSALELVVGAETDEQWRAWMLVADYLEELANVDS